MTLKNRSYFELIRSEMISFVSDEFFVKIQVENHPNRRIYYGSDAFTKKFRWKSHPIEVEINLLG